jgi:hypothetical protein
MEGVDVLLTEVIKKYYPNLVNPDLKRSTSKSHWRRNRNKTRREKAAALLAEPKKTSISRQLISGKDDFPLLSICDDDLDIHVTKEYDTIDIKISDSDLLAYDIEITGHCREEHLINLLDNLIDRVANKLKE